MRSWLAALLVLFCIAPAHADELRPGYLEFTQADQTDWSLVWKSPIKGGLTPQTQPILPDGCSVKDEPRKALVNATLVSTYDVKCTGAVAGKRIGLSNMETAQTDILVRVAMLDRPVQAMRFTAANSVAEIAEKPSGWMVAQTYFVTGIEHILFGFDHLLFVIALVLLLGGAWTVAKAVTAFTVAHSITLIGTTLGFFGLPQRPVEAVIALSIIFLAVEIIKRKPGKPRLSERAPWIIAFLFGLIHGFGFAGALSEIGLPESDIPTALLTFNLGVEAGQLAIVFGSLAVLWLMKRYAEKMMRAAIITGTYAIGITASFWFIERLL